MNRNVSFLSVIIDLAIANKKTAGASFGDFYLSKFAQFEIMVIYVSLCLGLT